MHRYAIGKAERPMLKSKIGWLDILANDTHEYYYPNNTGGPSIKVRVFRASHPILLKYPVTAFLYSPSSNCYPPAPFPIQIYICLLWIKPYIYRVRMCCGYAHDLHCMCASVCVCARIQARM